jgi:hypothetical protein
MSVKSIENSALGLAQINDTNGDPSIVIAPNGVVTLVSPNQSTSGNANAISTVSYVNNQIANASVSMNPAGSYKWSGTYNIFGNNQVIGVGSTTLPTVVPITGQTSSASGLLISGNANLTNSTDLYNFSNINTGGIDFWNISATQALRNYASFNPSAGNTIFNLKGTGCQYQINGVNILNNVVTTTTLASYAPINAPTFTGIPKAPTATAGTSSTQIATTAYVENAIAQTGSFNPTIAYTWSSPYQLFGNDQVLCVGSSLMNTNKPQTGLTAPAQGSQICNNTQLQGETDLVNYSANGQGGFCFQQMSATNTLTNLATMYRNAGACNFNLPNPSSQFQVNGTSIARQTTSTLSSTRVPQTLAMTVNGVTFTSTVTTATTITTNTINGTSVVNVDWITTASLFPLSAPLEISSVTTSGSAYSTTIVIAQLNGPTPSNNLTTAFNINMYLGVAGSIGTQINGYGAIVQAGTSYYVVFTSFTNIAPSTPICFTPFNFSYQ